MVAGESVLKKRTATSRKLTPPALRVTPDTCCKTSPAPRNLVRQAAMLRAGPRVMEDHATDRPIELHTPRPKAPLPIALFMFFMCVFLCMQCMSVQMCVCLCTRVSNCTNVCAHIKFVCQDMHACMFMHRC